MPVNDWTRVDAGIFHAFAVGWWCGLARWFNATADGSLYYALVEPAFGSPTDAGFLNPPAELAYLVRRRTVVIRATETDAAVALIEIVSPDVKASDDGIAALVRKVQDALDRDIGVLLIDLFSPGPSDPNGLHPLVWSSFKVTDYALPADKRLTLAAYAAGSVKRAFVEPVAVGDALPEMPLFLTPEFHIPVPLAATYEAAWSDVPRRWQQVLAPPADSA